MTDQQRRYVRIETTISVAINSLLSALFAFLVFGGRAVVPVGDVVFDALPQSFMIALMSTIVPTALTRHRLRAGKVAPLLGRTRPLPRNLLVRALVVAGAVAALATALHWLLLPLVGPQSMSGGAVMVYKVIYGGLLALLLAPPLIRSALADSV